MSSIIANLHGPAKTASGVYSGTQLDNKLSKVRTRANTSTFSVTGSIKTKAKCPQQKKVG